MGWLDGIARRLGYVRKGRRSAFAAADSGRLTASLKSETDFINTTLRYELRALRARSRQAAQNNPFARRFAQMVVDNVAGPQPFRLQAKVKNRSGKLDKVTNDKIELCWRDWSRVGACELSGRWSWNTLQRLIVRSLAIDGEVLIRKYRGPEYGRHGYKLQLVDIDRLWENHNKALPGGGAIHMSVEVDAIGRPVAYHLLKRKPSQWQNAGYTYEFERVAAEDMIHLFIPESVEQCRGVPWMYAALLNLVHIGAFEEAAVIAARVGASQMGVIESPDGGPGGIGDETNVDGQNEITAEPGSFPVLGPGYKLNSWNPKYPDAAIEPFLKATLRGVSAGLGVAYHNLSSDMEGVNYSSARVAELDERDSWVSIQNFVIEHLAQPNYDEWLRGSLLTQALPFEFDRAEKLREVYWQGKRWQWVDPQKEVTAALEAIKGNIKSRTRVVSELGEDFEDTVQELQQENEMLEAAGLGAPEPAKVEEPKEAPESKAIEELRAENKALRERPNVKIDNHMTVPEREISVNVGGPTVTVPEREVNITSPITVEGHKVDVKGYPSETVETIERDEHKEMTRITRRAKD